ncbi:MAG: tRNA (adenine(22)-N(1))-methyltransferase [Eubacteriales bacterium]
MIALSGRLSAAASFVRIGSVVADVGTDHAYLPIYLVEKGIAPFAVASDVREGPLDRANAHISACGLSSRIKTLLADGLDGVERYHPEDILICGMGGDLIASILDGSDYIKNPAVRLILQPMTMAHRLRYYLCRNGFRILDEELVLEKDSKLYQILVAQYCGVPAEISPAEAYLGKINLKKRHKLLDRLADQNLSYLNARIDGLKQSGRSSEEDERIRRDILMRMEESGYGNRQTTVSTSGQQDPPVSSL